MFVLNPDPYLLPSYNISPFQTNDIVINNRLPISNEIDKYFDQRFKGLHYSYTTDGRHAINTALAHYNLKPDDVVTIFTTSGNFYISSCVTKEIEKFCKWSRVIEQNSKVIFVNHEFGYPFTGIESLKKYNLPIIEDCAHSFFTTKNDIGKHGDFVIYSFPKMFPLQIGGLLVSGKKNQQTGVMMAEEKLPYIKNILSHYIVHKDAIIAKRTENYQYLSAILTGENIEERFVQEQGVVPGVFMFRVKNETADLQKLKKHLHAHGIQCSVFYGEQSFFIPVHQNLETEDMDYFKASIHSFLKSA